MAIFLLPIEPMGKKFPSCLYQATKVCGTGHNPYHCWSVATFLGEYPPFFYRWVFFFALFYHYVILISEIWNFFLSPPTACSHVCLPSAFGPSLCICFLILLSCSVKYFLNYSLINSLFAIGCLILDRFCDLQFQLLLLYRSIKFLY